ncbi:Phenylalanine--tRNA ligase beta subunit [uncultured archaeon]|nr:Phenylalanine--tRNA ligase beta subunit [uncultured archaeon]
MGEVVLNSKTRPSLAAASIHSFASFSEIRSLADAVLRELMIEKDCEIEPSEDGAFLSGRGADIVAGGKKIGCFGEVHPLVVRSFGLEQPVVAMELMLGDLGEC